MVLLFSLLLVSCGGKEEKKKEGFSVKRQKTTEKVVETPAVSETKASERVDLSTKGVGPVTSITLDDAIDDTLAASGKEVYEQLCLACHRVGKKFIGPAPDGILERRTPEWVMNMILNPDQMVKEDPWQKICLWSSTVHLWRIKGLPRNRRELS